jgi:hypothetical protein
MLSDHLTEALESGRHLSWQPEKEDNVCQEWALRLFL